MITPTRALTSLCALLQCRDDGPRRLPHVGILLVVVGEPVQEQDRLALRRAILEADDREPAYGHVRVAVRELFEQPPHGVHVAGVVAGETFERDQRRAAGSGALVLEPAADELQLLPEAELRDRPVGLCSHAVVGVSGCVLELVVPLLPQGRERLLVSGRGQLVGASCRLGERHEIEEAGRAAGPM